MNTRARRVPLGLKRGFGVSQEVYLADEWIENDEAEGHSIRRWRIPYDEVLLITRHVRRQWLLLVVVLFFGVPLLVGGLAMAVLSSEVVGGGVMAGFGLVVVVMGLVPGLRGTRVLSVYGARTMASVHFSWLHSKEALAYEQVLVRIRRARAATEARQAAQRASIESPFAPAGDEGAEPPAT